MLTANTSVWITYSRLVNEKMRIGSMFTTPVTPTRYAKILLVEVMGTLVIEFMPALPTEPDSLPLLCEVRHIDPGWLAQLSAESLDLLETLSYCRLLLRNGNSTTERLSAGRVNCRRSTHAAFPFAAFLVRARVVMSRNSLLVSS
jgi:hypothetical protein